METYLIRIIVSCSIIGVALVVAVISAITRSNRKKKLLARGLVPPSVITSGYPTQEHISGARTEQPYINYGYQQNQPMPSQPQYMASAPGFFVNDDNNTSHTGKGQEQYPNYGFQASVVTGGITSNMAYSTGNVDNNNPNSGLPTYNETVSQPPYSHSSNAMHPRTQERH